LKSSERCREATPNSAQNRSQANFITLKKHKTLIDQARRSGNFAA